MCPACSLAAPMLPSLHDAVTHGYCFCCCIACATLCLLPHWRVQSQGDIKIADLFPAEGSAPGTLNHRRSRRLLQAATAGDGAAGSGAAAGGGAAASTASAASSTASAAPAAGGSGGLARPSDSLGGVPQAVANVRVWAATQATDAERAQLLAAGLLGTDAPPPAAAPSSPAPGPKISDVVAAGSNGTRRRRRLG
jgi:hypothetical protein